MPLSPGTRLGSYEVVAAIGAGGMGEVYRATDLRLQRDIAIKVLPDTFAEDVDRRARFEREARAIAALSHPNILAIFDTGAHDGRLYLVTELLEGGTLRARLASGPLPVRKTIEIAVQIARGLAAAHDKGLVHRDLKPENIFLLADGHVKILDFGLARQVGAGAVVTSALATAAAETDPGTALGTVGYMAPEQVRGQTVDARADLFSFGAVVYEMLAGRRAFARETGAETMTAILRDDPPDLAHARADLPPAVDRIVRHCLEKSPGERFQTARDVAFALEAFSGAGSSTASRTAVEVAAPRRWRWAAAMLLLPLAGVGLGVALDHAARPPSPAVTFEAKSWDAEWITNARFAPDGQTIVFSAARSGAVPQLFVARRDTVAPQPLGDPGTHLLSISSKGELAVIVGARQSTAGHRIFAGTLARMTMDGAARSWMQDVTEADWSTDGSTLAVIRTVPGAFQLEYPVGRVLYQRVGGYLSDLRVSPDGGRVAFFDHQVLGDNRGWVKVVDRTGTMTTLAGEFWGEEGLAWSSDGRSVLFSASQQAGFYQPLVVNAAGAPMVRPAVSTAGTMVVLDVAADGRALVMRLDPRSSIRGRLPGESQERDFNYLERAYFPRLSRDGRSLLFTDESQSAGVNYAVALRDVQSGRVVRLGPGNSGSLSPDGRWAVAVTASYEEVRFYPVGAGDPMKLARGPIVHYSWVPEWMPDGRRVFFCGNEASKPPRCYVQEVPSGTPTAVTGEGVVRGYLAPDGRTVLASTTSETYELLTIGGGPSIPVKGLTPEDIVFDWTADSKGVMVSARSGVPTRVERVDPFTGTRTFVMTLGPQDSSGVSSVSPTQWIGDGAGYVYYYFRELSQLFVATGVAQ